MIPITVSQIMCQNIMTQNNLEVPEIRKLKLRDGAKQINSRKLDFT